MQAVRCLLGCVAPLHARHAVLLWLLTLPPVHSKHDTAYAWVLLLCVELEA